MGRRRRSSESVRRPAWVTLTPSPGSTMLRMASSARKAAVSISMAPGRSSVMALLALPIARSAVRVLELALTVALVGMPLASWASRLSVSPPRAATAAVLSIVSLPERPPRARAACSVRPVMFALALPVRVASARSAEISRLPCCGAWAISCLCVGCAGGMPRFAVAFAVMASPSACTSPLRPAMASVGEPSRVMERSRPSRMTRENGNWPSSALASVSAAASASAPRCRPRARSMLVVPSAAICTVAQPSTWMSCSMKTSSRPSRPPPVRTETVATWAPSGSKMAARPTSRSPRHERETSCTSTRPGSPRRLVMAGTRAATMLGPAKATTITATTKKIASPAAMRRSQRNRRRFLASAIRAFLQHGG